MELRHPVTDGEMYERTGSGSDDTMVSRKKFLLSVSISDHVSLFTSVRHLSSPYFLMKQETEALWTTDNVTFLCNASRR